MMLSHSTLTPTTPFLTASCSGDLTVSTNSSGDKTPDGQDKTLLLTVSQVLPGYKLVGLSVCYDGDLFGTHIVNQVALSARQADFTTVQLFKSSPLTYANRTQEGCVEPMLPSPLDLGSNGVRYEVGLKLFALGTGTFSSIKVKSLSFIVDS